MLTLNDRKPCMQDWLMHFERRNRGYFLKMWESQSGCTISHTDDVHMAHQISLLSQEEMGFDITAAAWRQFRTEMGWKGTLQHQDSYRPTHHDPVHGGLNSPPLVRKQSRADGGWRQGKPVCVSDIHWRWNALRIPSSRVHMNRRRCSRLNPVTCLTRDVVDQPARRFGSALTRTNHMRVGLS